ncbi:hypothetical protein [Sorangium sp. So ce1151]|uniref:hypothetical protein n=1 Tax=Sorangium sp. So ce1151 TaxID=3133332 RepID=UPI003F6396BC
MKLVAMITEPSSIARFLTALGEPTDVPARSPAPTRRPPYWKSTVLRRSVPILRTDIRRTHETAAASAQRGPDEGSS